MSTATNILPPRAVYTSEPIYRLTVDQWHDMIARGTLTADDPVELIEGVLVFKMPKNPPHETSIGLATDVLMSLLPAGWHLRIQGSITFADGEPEPDLAIVRGGRLDYAARHPGPSDIGLLIEIANSTLDRDRGPKLRSYARAGVACYWIVNLVDRQIETFTDPAPSAVEPRYRKTAIFRSGEIVPLMIEGMAVGQVKVEDVLPPVE